MRCLGDVLMPVLHFLWYDWSMPNAPDSNLRHRRREVRCLGVMSMTVLIFFVETALAILIIQDDIFFLRLAFPFP